MFYKNTSFFVIFGIEKDVFGNTFTKYFFVNEWDTLKWLSKKSNLNSVWDWNIQVKMTWRKSSFLWCQTLFWGRETLWQKHSSSSDFAFGRSRSSRDRGRSKLRVDERKRNRWRHRLLLATCCTVIYN